MRIFSGIRVATAFKEAYLAFQTEHVLLEKTRWTSLSKLHLTVWFYGNLAVEILPNLIAINKIIAQQVQPFELSFQQLKLAPSNQQARMVWANYNKKGSFQQLIDLHQRYLPQLGLVEKTFETVRPHVTLVRFPERLYSKNDFDFNSVVFPSTLPVLELVLWESVRTPIGNQYVVLHVEPF